MGGEKEVQTRSLIHCQSEKEKIVGTTTTTTGEIKEKKPKFVHVFFLNILFNSRPKRVATQIDCFMVVVVVFFYETIEWLIFCFQPLWYLHHLYVIRRTLYSSWTAVETMHTHCVCAVALCL